MAATATPGFPIVVTTLVNDTSRPAAAPDKTLTEAFSTGSAAGRGAKPEGTAEVGAADGDKAPVPGLNIIVFSKPSASPSPTNLIWYLPTSIESPSWSSCFLIVLPLT